MQTQLKTRSTRRAQTSIRADPVQLRNPESGSRSDYAWLPKFIRLPRHEIPSVFPEMWAKLWENALSCSVEKFCKNTWIRIQKEMTSKF